MRREAWCMRHESDPFMKGLPENFEEAVTSWRKQLQESLQSERKMAAEGWKALQRKIS